MALIKCSECGKEYSDKAGACPKCGAVTPQENNMGTVKRSKLMIIPAILVVVIIIGIIGSCSNKDQTKSENTYAALSDFEYTINGDSLTLELYDGDSETLIINSKYEVDGKEYTVTALEHAVFNGSDVTVLYVPKTIKTVYDDTLAYLDSDDGKVQIYYEGSKKKWKKVFKHYDTKKANKEKSKAEQKGAAAADKLNEMLGFGYKAENFQYHFNASIEDIK